MSVATLSQPINLTYFQPTKDGEKPWFSIGDGFKSNWEGKVFEQRVENVRGKEAEYSLDKTGFEFHKNQTSLSPDDFSDEEKIKNVYYDEVINTIKQHTGASKVVIFDHTVRSSDPSAENQLVVTQFQRGTANQVHVDQTPSAASRRVQRHLSEEEANIRLGKRYQIVNLWRPIRHEAYDKPLAVCDYRSVDPKKDLVPVILKYANYNGETYSVNYNPNHRWKYLKGMKPEEFILIKCADSITDGSVAICTPHTSFEDPTKPDDAKFRESIEVRTLVFYD